MQKKLKESLKKDKTQLDILRLEIGKVLTGDSEYSNEDLQSAINVLKERIAKSGEKLEFLKDEGAQKKAVSDNVIPAYRQFRSLAEEFDSANLEAKKMIACQMFERVEML